MLGLAIVLLWVVDFGYELVIGLHSQGTLFALIISYTFFILSELFIFLSCFAFMFNNLLNTTLYLISYSGTLNILFFSYALSFSNLLILLYSSLGFQSALIFIKMGLRIKLLEGLGQAFASGFLFITLQFKEYIYSFFTISDSFYSSIFYATTGLHGSHVIIGSLAILAFYLFSFFNFSLRQDLELGKKGIGSVQNTSYFKEGSNAQMYMESHLSLKLWSYYWHFVDII